MEEKKVKRVYMMRWESREIDLKVNESDGNSPRYL